MVRRGGIFPIIGATLLAGCLKPPITDPGPGPPKPPRWDTLDQEIPWEDKRPAVDLSDPASQFPRYFTRGPAGSEADGESDAVPGPDAAEAAGVTRPAEAQPWGMFQGDAGHTAFSTDERVQLPLLLKWRVPTAQRIEASPVVANGSVYAATYEGVVYAVSLETGEELWSGKVDGKVIGTPAIGGETLFVPVLDGNIYALDARDGTLRAKFKTRIPSEKESALLPSAGAGITASPILAGGYLYYSGHDGNLYQLDLKDHTVRETFSFPGPVRHGSFVISDHRAIAALETGEVVALDISPGEGRILWKTRLTNPGIEAFRLPLTLAGDRVLVATGRDAFLLSRRVEDGRLEWAAAMEGPVASPPAFDGKSAYVCSSPGEKGLTMVALDVATGEKRWRTRLPGKQAGPTAVVNGFVFVGLSGSGQCLAALDAATGELLWLTHEFQTVAAGLAFQRGHLVAATMNGYLAAYEPSDVLGYNPLLPADIPLPNPYVDWHGHLTDFQWRFGRWPPAPARIVFRMSDFIFVFHPADDATPWQVLSKPMVPLEPFLLGPTYTGLLFPSHPEAEVRVIGLKGIDRPKEKFYDVKINDPNRVLTALIIARKLRGHWRPIYANNYFTSWRLNRPGAVDAAIAGYYLGRHRPFDVCMRVEKETLPLLSTFDRAFISQAPKFPVVYGRIVPGQKPSEVRFQMTHYWGQRPREEDIKLYYGDVNRLRLLELDK